MKLGDLEIAGIRQLFEDGKSVTDVLEMTAKNKKKLVQAQWDEIAAEAAETQQIQAEEAEVEETLMSEWEPIFKLVLGRMRMAGVPEPDVNRIFEKIKTELDLGSLEPDADKLYLYCIQKWGGGNLIGKTTERGNSGTYSMNAGASGTKASNDLLRSQVKSPIEANIFRPNG